MKRAVAAAAVLLALAACGASQKPDDLFESARLALRQGRLADARRLADRGVSLAQAQAGSPWEWTFRLLRAEIQIYQNDLADARPAVNATLPSGSAFDELRARQQYLAARLTLADGRLREALELVQRARALAKRRDDQLEIDDLDGQLHLRLGRWSDGESILSSVVARAASAGDRYHQALALNDLGMGYVVRSRFDEALPWFERILSLTDLQPFTLFPRALFNAGICYTMLGQFDRAVDVQRRAVEAYEQRGAGGDREKALGQFGSTLVAKGAAREGVQYLVKAFDIAIRSNLSDDAAIWAGNLAAANIDLQDWANARRYNDEARRLKLARRSADFVHNTLNDAQIAAGLGQREEAERLFGEALAANAPPDVVWEAQAGLARVALAAGRRDAANRYFQATLDTIERTRSDLLKSDYKVSFLSRLIQFYQAYVDALVDEGRIARALEIADASRGRVLAEREGVAAPRRESADTFRRVAAGSGAVLLSYWLAPARSYLWIVTGGRIELRPLPPERDIEALVRAHQSAIASALGDPLSAGNTAGQQLYHLLIGPAARFIPAGATVVIVSDGILHGLNFETLPVDRPQRHYWIDDVDVVTAPALSMLRLEDAAPTREPSLLVVGNPVPRPPDFPALTYAANEMAAVTAHFGAGHVTRLEGERASPEGYESAHPDRFAFVHFAAHAAANVESPLDSAIILSGADNRYKLYARDVADRPLRAELVTVSACRSAGGRAYAGEGLIGFAWAFLRAGAQRVVAGLWDVDDQSTAALMDGLYAGIAAGEPPGRALRRAKLDLIHRGGIVARPYYWAPFELFTVVLPRATSRRSPNRRESVTRASHVGTDRPRTRSRDADIMRPGYAHLFGRLVERRPEAYAQ
ncbi:MAG: CHAT domain-containing protein [Betaproteobacteria bacterium]